jgi:hypothetical protein
MIGTGTQPLPRDTTANAESDKEKERDRKREDEIRREEMEIFALKQMIAEKQSEVPRLSSLSLSRALP